MLHIVQSSKLSSTEIRNRDKQCKLGGRKGLEHEVGEVCAKKSGGKKYILEGENKIHVYPGVYATKRYPKSII